MLHGYGPALAGGLLLTLQIAALSLAIACAFGLVGAVASLSGSRAARLAAGAYTTLIRGLPELVLMLMLFYGGQVAINSVADSLGFDPLDIDPFMAGTLTMGFISGAYLAETFRGAILAVPRGQIEAAEAYGFRRQQILWRFIVPPMIRHAIPGFTNNWLVLVKATALVSVIGLDDLVHRAGLAAAATREPFTFYAAIALVYLAVTTVSIVALNAVDRRFSAGIRRVAA